MCSSSGLIVARDLTLALKANCTRHHYRVLIGTPWYNLISFPSNYRGQWSLTHFIEDQLRLIKVKGAWPGNTGFEPRSPDQKLSVSYLPSIAEG